VLGGGRGDIVDRVATVVDVGAEGEVRRVVGDDVALLAGDVPHRGRPR
jgi:hypothetical protein